MLDNLARLKRLDPGGTFGIVSSLPEQLEEGLDICGKAGIGYPEEGRIVVMGMGGSAIAGDLAATLGRAMGREVLVLRDYRLPDYLDSDDYLVFMSYSGETWETIFAHREALRRGLPCLTVSSGGELHEVSAARGDPYLRIPRGLPPRGALGYLLAPLLAILMAQSPSLGRDLGEAIRHLSSVRGRWSPAIPTAQNQAKSIALELEGRTPIIYATPDFEGVARRWRSELNEMAKVLAWGGVFPEADHNELVGWMEDGAASRFAPILLTAPGNPLLDLQTEETVRMVEERVPFRVIRPGDTNILGQILELVHLGDMVSLYLAMVRGVDPMPVDAIVRLKEAVSKRKGEA